MPHRKTAQILPVVAAAVISTAAVWSAAASDDFSLCPDLRYLIEQSGARFSAVRGDRASEIGGTDATLVLPGAWYCVVVEDVEKSSYRCVWKYPLGDEQAHKKFRGLVKEMRSCIGEIAEERTDQPVNHPDIYASQFYELPGARASVSLKNKSNLTSTLVSIRIDGFSETQ